MGTGVGYVECLAQNMLQVDPPLAQNGSMLAWRIQFLDMWQRNNMDLTSSGALVSGNRLLIM